MGDIFPWYFSKLRLLELYIGTDIFIILKALQILAERDCWVNETTGEY
jgi:hypothetical protein